jgi:hypothetical protein
MNKQPLLKKSHFKGTRLVTDGTYLSNGHWLTSADTFSNGNLWKLKEYAEDQGIQVQQSPQMIEAFKTVPTDCIELTFTDLFVTYPEKPNAYIALYVGTTEKGNPFYVGIAQEYRLLLDLADTIYQAASGKGAIWSSKDELQHVVMPVLLKGRCLTYLEKGQTLTEQPA